VTDLFGIDQYEGLERTAEISACGRYRWWLTRSWRSGGDGRRVCFLMLNPSRADGLVDDPTVRRCLGFARAWGFSSLSIRNLFPFRATDPTELRSAHDPVGGSRGDAEVQAAVTADLVLCAWGAGVPFGRDRDALRLLAGKPLYCLGVTKGGHPRHPLYVKANQQPLSFPVTT
jgi:hypothetical protein